MSLTKSKVHIVLDDSARSLAAKELLIILTGNEKKQKFVAIELIEKEFIKSFGKKRFNDIQKQFNKKG
tara:strand:- start:127 stop:330 length:204 start_codon:yes stop_codon:yes gene_type:complete